MELNNRERKMYEWLKQQDAAWPTIRWIIVVASIVCLFVFFMGYCNDLVLLIVGVMGLSYTVGSWAGRAEVSLLLKLIEESKAKQD